MRIKHLVTTVDTNTEGGPTRIITSGIQPLKGTSIAEKRDYFKANHDYVRNCLLNHPRGYPGMFGAVITESTQPDADIGTFFLTNIGYLDMCVHSAIGVAAACLETGMINLYGEKNLVRLETPLGIISLWPNYNGKDLDSVSIEPAPSFVHTDKLMLDIGLATPIEVSILFSSVYFIMVNIGTIGIHVAENQEGKLREIACKSIEKANQFLSAGDFEQTEQISIDLAFLYEDVDSTFCRSAVFSKTGVIDRSPCGAGTAAKMTLMYKHGELALNSDYTNGNFSNTKFKGQVIRSQKNEQENKVWSIISGSAHITGFHQFIIDASD